MSWKTIRLELAQTWQFPEGSASRAYLLRLPVDDEGRVEESALRATPAWATVRRFWPNEPDMAGHVIPSPSGFPLSYRLGEDDAAVIELDPHPLLLGEYLNLTEPDGRQLPFRVTSIAVIAGLTAAA